MQHIQALLLLLVISATLLATYAEAEIRPDEGDVILQNVPEVPPELAESLRVRQEFRSVGFLDWAGAEEGMLVATRCGAIPQIYRIKTPLGAHHQLTFSSEPLRSAVAQPGGEGFIYTEDKSGDEYYQLYFKSLRSGKASRITDGKRSRNLGALWSKDGRQLAYLHSPEGTNRFQIRVASFDELSHAKTILDREGAFAIDDWSVDGRLLLVSRYVSMTESYIYTLSVADGQLREINPRPIDRSPISYYGGQYPQFLGGLTGGPPRGGRFSRDGGSVYVISDQNSEFARLVRIDLSTGERSVISKHISWDVEALDLSPDGSTLVYSVNEEGASKLHIIDAATGAALPAPSLPHGVIGNRGFDPQGNRFAFTFYATTGPADIYAWSVRDNLLTRWSESEAVGANPVAMTDPQLVRFQSFDKRSISAFLYRPKRKGKLPVIIHVHGGPEAQFRPTFSPYGPVISGLELGFAVIAPNVRGSTGYGKTFVALDNGLKREDSVKDIGALLDWIAVQSFLDKDRVVLYGASYGGYMVNATIVNFPNRIKAGISIVAISDFYSYLKNTAEYRRDLRRAEYGDERDPKIAAFMKRIAPLARADRIAASMFIVHGSNDPRVPVSEAEQLFSALQANGAKPWLMIAKNEGHGFQKQANVIRLDAAVTLFLEQVVLGKAGQRVSPSGEAF